MNGNLLLRKYIDLRFPQCNDTGYIYTDYRCTGFGWGSKDNLIFISDSLKIHTFAKILMSYICMNHECSYKIFKNYR